MNNCVIDVFIARNLNDWLQSMHRQPYELQVSTNVTFQEFLTMKQYSIDGIQNFLIGLNVNIEYDNKTIFKQI